MWVLKLHRGATFGFWLSLLFAVSCCYGKDETVEVVGFVERTDFAQSKIKTSQTFSGGILSLGFIKPYGIMLLACYVHILSAIITNTVC